MNLKLWLQSEEKRGRRSYLLAETAARYYMIICRIATSFCRQAENLKKSRQENFCLFPIMHKAKGS